MEWLGEIAKHHKNYVKVIHSFGEYFYAEDLVQEMYLRLDRNKRPEDIIVDGKINQYFIHLTLKSIFLNFLKAKKQISKINNLPLEIADVDNSEFYEAQNRFRAKINNEINKWHSYDQTLFRLYLTGNHSMRDIANGTDISLRSIFEVIGECKEKIRVNCGDDYLDLINNDLELI